MDSIAPATSSPWSGGYRPVYAVTLALDAEQGAAAIWRTVTGWLQAVRREEVEIDALQQQGNIILTSGASLSVLYSDSVSPYLHAVRYANADSQLQGRRWIAEIGLRVADGARNIDVSIVLATDDVAASNLPEPVATRPALVWQLITRNKPDPSTPGLSLGRLDASSSQDFRRLIREPKRTFPLIVLSATPSGEYLADPETLGRQVAGLASVFAIPHGEDTKALSNAVGEEGVPWMGGARILYPVQAGPYATPVPVRRVSPQEFDDWRIAGSDAERELFRIVARRTVRVGLARHVTVENIREEKLRRSLTRRSHGESTQLREDITALEGFLVEYEKQIEDLKGRVDARELHIDMLDENIRGLNDDVRKAAHDKEALTAQFGKFSDQAGDAASLDEGGRRALVAILGGKFKLPDALKAVAALYPDRLVVLESAWKAAEKSAVFRHVDKGLELLLNLAGGYWEAMIAGGGDSQAKGVFGAAYAATETDGVANNPRGKRRRTFKYQGQDVVMLKHLKIGVKDSATETLRIHFMWDPEERVVVIGHCGKHLNFD